MSRDDPFGLSEDRERTRIRLVGPGPSPACRRRVPAGTPSKRLQRPSPNLLDQCLRARCWSSRRNWRARPRPTIPRRCARACSTSWCAAATRRWRAGVLAGARRPGGLGGGGAARRSRAQHAMGRRQRLAAPAAGGDAARRRRRRHAVLRAAGGAGAPPQPRPRHAGAAISLPGAGLPRQVPRPRPGRRPVAQRRAGRRGPLPARCRRRGRAAVAQLARRGRLGRARPLHRADLGDGAWRPRCSPPASMSASRSASPPRPRSSTRWSARCRRPSGRRSPAPSREVEPPPPGQPVEFALLPEFQAAAPGGDPLGAQGQ